MERMVLPKAGSRHWNFFVALGVGVVGLAVTLLLSAEIAAAVAASVFSLAYLVLTARDVPKLNPDYLREHAADEDAPPLIVFVLTIGVVVYVLVALFMVLNDDSPEPWRLILGVVSVALSWLMIHVMWGMHYAWEYYAAPAGKADRKQAGGLEFPGGEDPDGVDFIYFSLVIAMTAQTSDTDVTSRNMRRIVSGHSLFSYLFNTVIIAAAVNIVVSLGQG
jgi:uncharacterized membrane protein